MKTSFLATVLLLASLAWLPDQAVGATYYISSSLGSDSNTSVQAQSSSTPWQNARGMLCATGNAATYTPVAGDRFIFRGGDTWGNSCFYWPWSWSGTSGSRIYLGNDGTFGTGRPIFDLQGSVATTKNAAIWLTGNYVTIDNIEFTGLKPSTGTFGEDAFINPQLSTNFTISNNYFHGWTEIANSDNGRVLASNTGYPTAHTGAIFEFNVIDGSDTVSVLADPNCTGACQGSMTGIFGTMPITRYNVFRYISNGMVGGFDQVYGNLFEFIRDSLNPGAHENGFENNGSCGTLFYDNILRHLVAGVTVFLAEWEGCVGAAWNNVIYDTTAGNVFNLDIPTAHAGCTADAGGYCPAGTQYVWNNIIQCGPESNPTFLCVGGPRGSSLGYKYEAITIQNNHWITSNANPSNCTASWATTCTVGNNVTQTLGAANTQGYTSSQTYAYSPTDSGDATVGAGTNLTSQCATYSSLCSDTNYAVVYTSSSHTASTPGRTAGSRPASGAWDSGAYQLASSGTQRPPAAWRPANSSRPSVSARPAATWRPPDGYLP